MFKDSAKALVLTSLLGFSPLSWAEIEADMPYARAVPPGQMNSAAFMTLKNSANSDAALVAASSSVAEHVELHTHTHANGVMQMRQVDEIVIPGQSKTTLKPGGYHIMLIGLKRDLIEGEQIDMQLRFADDSTLQLKLPVQKVMAHKHHH